MYDGGGGDLTPATPAPYYSSTIESGEWRRLMRIALRRKRLVAAVAASILAIAALGMLVAPRRYEATTTLVLAPSRVEVTPDARTQQDPRADNAAIDTQVELLRSRALAARIVGSLGLGQGAIPQKPAERNALVDQVQGALHIDRLDGTQVVDVTARADTPVQAATLANAAATQFVALQGAIRAAHLDRTLSWLSRRTQELQSELEAKEKAVEEYRASNGLLASNGVTLNEQQIAQVQSAVLAAKADVAAQDAKAAEIARLRRAGASVETVSGVINSPTIVELRAREADIARRQADLEQRYGALHPALRGVLLERDSVRAQIAAEVARIGESANTDASVARSRLHALQSSYGSAIGQLSGSNKALVRLNQLEREATAARSVYEGFLERRHVLTEQSELTGEPASIVARAEPPTAPARGRPMLVMLLALGGGIALGLLAAFALDYLDPRIDSAEDVERVTGAPVLSSAPKLPASSLEAMHHRNPAAFLQANPLSGYAEGFRVLRSMVNRLTQGQSAVIAITSAMPGEGKSTTAVCLARATAAAHRSVIVVDCDLRRHSINHILGIEPRRGLQQVLREGLDWRDVVGVDESGAHVLAAASTSDAPVDMFSTSELSLLLEELRQAYELVILDCPPLLSLSEAHDIARASDFTVLVARSGVTPAPALAAALRRLVAGGARPAGVMLNGVSPMRHIAYADPLYFTPTAA